MLYPGSSITASHLRTGAGILPASVAVTIHSAPERSNGTSRYASLNVRRRLRLEDIEQHAGGLVVHPVDPLEDEDHVVDARLAQALDDATGADASSTPVEQAFGVLPAQRHLHVGAVERRGRGHRQRRLPPSPTDRPGTEPEPRPWSGRTTSASGSPVAATPRPSRAPSTVSSGLFVGGGEILRQG